MRGENAPSRRLARSGAPAALALALTGCASLVPVGSVLESMEDSDVDVVVAKVADHYPNMARFVISEGFVVVLDTIVVGTAARGGPELRNLVQTVSSYMLGDTVGKHWNARVGEERAVFGEGTCNFVVARASGGDRYLLNGHGFFNLVLPLGGGDRRAGGIELVTYDMRFSNQDIDVEGEGPVSIYSEILPRKAVYPSGGPMYARWADSALQLSWRGGRESSESPADASGVLPPVLSWDERRTLIQKFLDGAKSAVGPLVRLELKFRRVGPGLYSLQYGEPNRIELVLPRALVAGNRESEETIQRLAVAYPDYVSQEGSHFVLCVGYYFFDTTATRPGASPPEERKANQELKTFRIPPRGS